MQGAWHQAIYIGLFSFEIARSFFGEYKSCFVGEHKSRKISQFVMKRLSNEKQTQGTLKNAIRLVITNANNLSTRFYW